uniref:Charged multivesicular body protein 6 n=1 Tax=Lygus hesperus TaxID=30085 RepID=A0A0A9Y4V5_LYGHE
MGASSSLRGKDQNNRVTAQDKAILKVKLLRDTVKVYLRNVEQSLQYEQDLALQLIQKGRRERAKCILRKQLVLLEHLRSTDRQLEILEESIISLESSSIQAKIFEGLRTGNLALKRANEVLNIKNVELILEETAQAIEKQEEINKMVSVLGMSKSEEKWDLERELDSLLEKSQPAVAVFMSSSSKVSKATKEPSSTSQEDTIPEEKPSKGNNVRSLKAKFKKKLGPSEKSMTQPSTSSPTKGKTKKSKNKNSSNGPNTASVKPKEVGISINCE